MTRIPTKVVDPLNLPPAASETELSPEQQENAGLRHQLAVALGRKDGGIPAEPALEAPVADNPENILIHILEDGFSALGQIWYRGQEIEFTPGSGAFKDTIDREGKSWLLLTEDQQFDHYGKVYFKRGPWKGKGYDAVSPIDFPALKVIGGDAPVRITAEDLAVAASREANRRRAAPRLHQLR